MSPSTRDAVEQAVDTWLEAAVRAYGRGPVAADVDLHDAGLLDSVSLVDLLHAVERASGQPIDLLDLDLDALTTTRAVKDELLRVLAG